MSPYSNTWLGHGPSFFYNHTVIYPSVVLPPVLYKWRQEENHIDQDESIFFATKEELYYMIAGYINTLQTLWITK
jgi:hypothetical protein